MPHLVATLIDLSQMYSYYIRGDMSPLNRGQIRSGSKKGKTSISSSFVFSFSYLLRNGPVQDHSLHHLNKGGLN